MLRREPSVAGMFYSDNTQILQEQVDNFLQAADAPGLTPKALIVPHAGYIYSGAVAASAYRLLQHTSTKLSRVVILGPSHRVPLPGLGAPSVSYFRTPLGDVGVDRKEIKTLLEQSLVNIRDEAHQFEHSLEVQLPFLQRVIGDFLVLPLVVGNASSNLVAEVLSCVWGGDETLIVISSDLSHYHPYREAQRLDHETTMMIEGFDSWIMDSQACGSNAVNGLLRVARNKKMSIKTLDLRNSGDTAGDKDRVVGYGAYAIY